jgi:hypothetical protein
MYSTVDRNVQVNDSYYDSLTRSSHLVYIALALTWREPSVMAAT